MSEESDPTESDPAEATLQDRIQKLIPWQYRFELAPGVLTPNTDDHHDWNVRRRKLILGVLDGLLQNPVADLYPQCTFLDCGCNAGAWSFELHRRGARRVQAFDGRDVNVEKCNLVRESRGIPESELQFRQTNLYDLEHTFEPTDVVMALGILYHLSNPVEVVRQLANVTRWMLLVDCNVNTQPGSVCVFRAEDPELHHNGIEASVLVPNRNALVSMLHAAGFGTVTQVMPPAWAPQKYRQGERVLLLATKAPGPDLKYAAF
jgi:tRNA (mo5U34)-methyltransferase